MSYSCILGIKKECDGCEVCKERSISGRHISHLSCDVCEVRIDEGEIYYRIDGEILCKDCMDDLYGYVYEGED